MQNRLGLLVSLHDVTPAHAARLARAERLLIALGVPAVTYLFVPNFHGRFPANADADFVKWCRAARPYKIEWFLHGLFHMEAVGAAGTGGHATWTERFARRFLTSGEGEFLALRGAALEVSLTTGIALLAEVVGHSPSGFVAPAWLYNEQLLPALRRLAVRYTESHFYVFDLQHNRTTAAPVITWASRTAVHRAASVVTAALERQWWIDRLIVRVALHPADFDHQRIVDSIARTLDAWLANRTVLTVSQALSSWSL